MREKGPRGVGIETTRRRRHVLVQRSARPVCAITALSCVMLRVVVILSSYIEFAGLQFLLSVLTPVASL